MKLMMNLLTIRENIKLFLQKNHFITKPISKFIMCFILFFALNQLFGYSDLFENKLIIVGLSFICTWLPMGLLYLISGVVSIIQLLSLSLEVSLIYIFIFTLAYVLYIRFDVKYSLGMIFAPVLFVFNIPFLIPLLLGMFVGPVAVIPTAVGVIIYYFSTYVKDTVTILNTTASADNMQAYSYIIDKMIHDKNLVLTLIVFSVVIVVTNLVYTMSRDNSWYIAIGTGGLVNILLFLVGSYILETDTSVFTVIIGTVIAVVIALIVQFFKCVVDYSRTEHVQYEDDEYYYYVKAVPKIYVTARQVKIKRINTRKKFNSDED